MVCWTATAYFRSACVGSVGSDGSTRAWTVDVWDMHGARREYAIRTGLDTQRTRTEQQPSHTCWEELINRSWISAASSPLFASAHATPTSLWVESKRHR